MKLIIKEYLSSLKERGELDAMLPDLLSQLGLNVYSRPGRGTRQDGVDVGAFGSLDSGPEKVYLFSIKPGDLNRRDWDGDSAQSLRPSLNEIIDSYIPNRLPAEYRDKEIVICITIGGDVLEQVRPLLTGYISQNSRQKIRFEEWNGDKLASYIQSSFLREDLLPKNARARLRKSLAMLDEPEVSFHHFSELIRSLSSFDKLDDRGRITAVRQISICLWILFSWGREANNVESAYLSSEISLLHAWSAVRLYTKKNTKAARAINTAFFSTALAYFKIQNEFLGINVLPYVDKLHAISSAIRGSCSLDINLKLFDLLGRLGIAGIWAYWTAVRCSKREKVLRDQKMAEMQMCAHAIKALISNNPALLLPIKDDQAIDMSISITLLTVAGDNRKFLTGWFSEMLERARFSYRSHGKYPCVLDSYGALLEHPKSASEDYRESATSGSILYPLIALWAALFGDDATYDKVVVMKEEMMQHCTFQFWYPDSQTETYLYTDSKTHGAVLANLAMKGTKEEFLAQAFGECDQGPHFDDLSATKFGWWPLVAVACRHYRLPLPLHFFRGLYKRPTKAGIP